MKFFHMYKLFNISHWRSNSIALKKKNYLKFIDLNQYSTVISTCEKLESDYENVRYTNFNDYPDFKTYDFMDSDHLNAKGAAKLSVLVNKL